MMIKHKILGKIHLDIVFKDMFFVPWENALPIVEISILNPTFLSQTVCVCHRQSVSVTDNLRLSQAVCVCHRQPVSVTDNLCQSQPIFVCHRQSVSDTDTLLDHSWPGFCLFIRDFHQDLSVRFEFVRRLNTTNTNFVDPYGGGR